jgi:hypothetical protein
MVLRKALEQLRAALAAKPAPAPMPRVVLGVN